jgi:hypothetical protein
MNQKRIFPVWLSCMLLLTVACLSLTAPRAGDSATPTSAPAQPVSTATTAPTPTEIIASTKTVPAASPTAASPTQAFSPTATLFPEKLLHRVTDQTGAIEANIPTLWTDLRTEPWLDDQGQTLGTTFIASTDIAAFLKFQAEGVAISVSRRLPVGYIQLLETEYAKYIQHCEDTYKTRWNVEDPIYTGKHVVFGECNGQRDTWLSLFSVVNKRDPSQYIARVVAYDMIPTYGDEFRDIIMKFKVFPENLP